MSRSPADAVDPAPAGAVPAPPQSGFDAAVRAAASEQSRRQREFGYPISDGERDAYLSLGRPDHTANAA